MNNNQSLQTNVIAATAGAIIGIGALLMINKT